MPPTSVTADRDSLKCQNLLTSSVKIVLLIGVAMIIESEFGPDLSFWHEVPQATTRQTHFECQAQISENRARR